MTAEDQLQNTVVSALQVRGGALVLPEPVAKTIAEEINASPGKQLYAVALIALAKRLQAMPGSRPATQSVTLLAALALGDATATAR